MKIKKNIVVSENGFVFDSSTGESYSVNQTGAEIIHWMKTIHDQEKIKQKMVNKYEVDEVIAEKDLYDFISILKQYELLETENTDNKIQ